MSFSQKAIQGFVWNHLGKLAEIGLTYAVSIVVARTTGAQEYGVYVTTMSMASVALIVGAAGIDDALNKFVSQLIVAREETRLRFLVRRLLVTRFALGALLCLLIVTFRSQISLLFGNENLPRYILAIALYILLQNLVNFFTNFYVAQAKTRFVFVINTSARILNLALVWLFLLAGLGLQAIFLLFGIVSALSMVFMAGSAFPSFRGECRNFDLGPVRKFSIVMLLNSFLALVLGRYSNVLLISYFWGSSDQTGFYDIAFSLTIMIEYAFALGFAGLALSLAAELAMRDPAKLGAARSMVVKYYQMFVIPVALFCIWYADAVVRILYTPQYLATVPLFRTFLSLQCLSVTLLARDFNATILFSVGKERLVLITRSIVGVVSLLVNWFIIPVYGALGAITVTGLTYLATTGVEYGLVSRMLVYRYDYKFAAKVIGVSVCALAAVSVIPVHSVMVLLAAGIAYVVVVFGGYWLTRVFDKDIHQLLERSGLLVFRRSM